MNLTKFDNTVLKLVSPLSHEKVKQFLEYNVHGGKGNRYKLVEYIVSHYNKDTDMLTGYLMELFQAGLLVSDDIMDNSEYRRGKACFYKIRGMVSLKDSVYIYSVISKLFPNECVKSFYECLFKTCVGQSLDTKKKERKEYTRELYNKICELKTSDYSIKLPIYCGYSLVNMSPPNNLHEFSRLIGIAFQMQDDYLNFFPEKSGKSGNDLEEMKLTYFTSILSSQTNNLDVNEYFKNGIITAGLVMVIEKHFKDYREDMKIIRDQAIGLLSKSEMYLFDFIQKFIQFE